MKNGKTSLKVSDKIELRLPEAGFADTLFDLIDAQRPYLRRWLSWVDKTDSSQDVKEFLKTSRMFNTGGQKLTTFIFYENKIAGSVGFEKINKDHHFAEIGYWLSEDLQGLGIVTLSCKTLIDYTFKHMAMNRIEVKIISKNLKSLAIPKKLGFTHEGTLRDACALYGTFYDLELFSLLKSDWLEKA